MAHQQEAKSATEINRSSRKLGHLGEQVMIGVPPPKTVDPKIIVIWDRLGWFVQSQQISWLLITWLYRSSALSKLFGIGRRSGVFHYEYLLGIYFNTKACRG